VPAHRPITVRHLLTFRMGLGMIVAAPAHCQRYPAGLCVYTKKPIKPAECSTLQVLGGCVVARR
jgi:hypothetical protein